jgi:hypothetical protein
MKNTDRLNDEVLESVSGGLNPQPLPPGPGDPFSVRSFISHFSMSRFSFLRFMFR